MKYALTQNKIIIGSKTLYQIRALKSFEKIKVGI